VKFLQLLEESFDLATKGTLLLILDLLASIGGDARLWCNLRFSGGSGGLSSGSCGLFSLVGTVILRSNFSSGSSRFCSSLR
jgi:hypothetical protein